MFRNVLAATLRNLMRNRLYAAISIGGLAIGMAAALLTALFVRSELTFDRFIPGRERVFVVFTHSRTPGRGDTHYSMTDPRVAAWLKLDFPEVVATARANAVSAGVRSARTESNDGVLWVDPDFFRVLAMPALAGDPASTMQRADGLVLTRAAARKYFGQDAPIGQTLQLDRTTTLRVGAVIRDLPGNSNVQYQVFASGRSSASTLAQADAVTPKPGLYRGWARTYVRLKRPGDAARIDAAMPAFIRRRIAPPAVMANSPFFQGMGLALTPIDAMHMQPDTNADVHPGSMASVYALSIIAGLILLLAAVNFVNLQTARGARRGLEVGVRKVSGAGQPSLIAQFLGESMVYAILALALALSLAELALPALDALVRRRIPFLYWHDPVMMALAAGLTVALGLGAGAYPAVVLSRFRPAAVLKGGLVQAGGSKAVRTGLVIGQFAVLIALLTGALAVYAQTRFALTTAVGLDKAQMLQVTVPNCRGRFVDEVRALPGVAKSACSSSYALGIGDISTTARRADGGDFLFSSAPIDFGFFEAYGVKPLAGRLPSPARGGDSIASDAPRSVCEPSSVVVNASAVRAFRFASPEKMVGASILMACGSGGASDFRPVQVMGVVPDIAHNLTTGAVKPTFYPVDQRMTTMLSLKVRPDQATSTLAAIDRTWTRIVPARPIRRQFMDAILNRIYADLISQGQLLAALTAVAALIAGLGLFGLAAFTIEQRTKEIGVRKAMGASTPDILRLLLWSFAQPVAWGSLIAWPLGAWALEHWLRGFSAHISLSPWFFLAAAGAALAISLVTVLAHTLRVASAKPVGALRYE